MRFYFRSVILCGVMALAACANLPSTTGTTSTVKLGTFNDQAALIEQGVLKLQATTTALLRAGTINRGQDQNVQAQLTLVHNSVTLAKSLQSSNNPTQAQAELTSAQAILGALETKATAK